MAQQPNNILLKFINNTAVEGDNILQYYYVNGTIYVDGSEYFLEFKTLNLTQEQLSKTTRLVKKEDNLNGQSYTTIEGEVIVLNPNDELFVIHNYTGNTNLDKEFNQDSWWYDVKWHKSYRVYLVTRYTDGWTDPNGDLAYNWKVVETRVVYKADAEDDNSGVYTFNALPLNDIGITSSILVDQEYNGNTWEKVQLKLWYNNAIIAQEELDTTSVSLPERMTLLVDYQKDAIQVGDQLKISVGVSDAPNIHDDSLYITEYTMSLSSETIAGDVPETILGFNENLGLDRDFDCQPTINNVVISRQSRFIQDVDYSISSTGFGISVPQNLSLILDNRATKAEVPDSNYSQYSSIIPRYYGSKTNRQGINISSSISYNFRQVDPSFNQDLPLSPFYFDGDNLGSFPNVESKNSYIGYFEKVIDPYPVLNGKTAYFVKYLIDENTDVLDPSITTQGLNNLKNTFKLNDVNNLPTFAKASVANIDEARELKDLEALSSVYRTAVFPSPILYSQTSSNGYSNTIQMTGSGGDYLVNVDINPDTYKNIAFISTDSIPTEASTPDNPITSLGGGLNSNGNDFAPDETQFIGSPNLEIYQNNGIIRINENSTIDSNLTDNYNLTIDYNFYTTHLPPYMVADSTQYVGGYNPENLTPVNPQTFYNFGAMEFFAREDGYLGDVMKSLSIDKVELIVWYPDPTTGGIAGPHVKGEGRSLTIDVPIDTVILPQGQGYSFNRDALVEDLTEINQTGNIYLGTDTTIIPGPVKINFDCQQIYTLIRQHDNSFPEWLVKGTWDSYSQTRTGDINTISPNLNDEIDYNKGAYLQWKVKFKRSLRNLFVDPFNLTPPEEEYSLRIKRRGSIELPNFTVGSGVNNIDLFFTSREMETETFSNGLEYYPAVKLNRSFNPPGINNISSHYLKFDLRGLSTPTDETLGLANAPYWDFVNPNNRSRIYLVPNLLNNNYGTNYFQGDTPYFPSTNTAFPFAVEPSYTRIPTPSDPFELFPGDQIRFMNLESQTYTIENINEQEVNGQSKVVLQLDKEISSVVNLDFFLIRRFKPSNNFIILNQQKPYGVPPSASSSPGILQTQYQNKELETNPDKVITNLIERSLI